MGVRLVNLAGGQSLVAIARNAESAEAISAAGAEDGGAGDGGADDGGAEDDPGEVADDGGPAAVDAADVSAGHRTVTGRVR